MTKILVLGYDPLPFAKGKRQFAPGIRTWQLTQPLIRDSHEVCLVCARMPTYEVDRSEEERLELVEGMTYHSLRRDVIHQGKRIDEICKAFAPDCIVGVTHYPAYLAAMLPSDKPLWADLFGHAMAEAQVKALSTDNNFHLQYSWNQEIQTLKRGDKFSVLSDYQKYATIGELGAIGRLNKRTVGYELCYKIPCGYIEEERKEGNSILRGKLVDKGDFIVLWAGGYNTWADTKTLFKGLEYAMDKSERVKFISLGGSIEGHDERTYPDFVKMVECSPHKERYIFRGWVPHEEVLSCLHEADVALCIDKFSHECMFGSRNRLLEWMFEGVLILTTQLCELSCIIESEKLGFTIKPENPEELGRMISRIMESKEESERRREKGRDYGKNNFNFYITTEPLRQWCKKPYNSPDHTDKFFISWGNVPRGIIYMNFLKEHGLKGVFGAISKKFS
ncbi:glycosyltransferase [bacterium]|nr:glycosyltransferase [bacterium]